MRKDAQGSNIITGIVEVESQRNAEKYRLTIGLV